MHVLVLGGTKFVGQHIVLSALGQGHSVTVFTRGQTPDNLPAEVSRLHGNRDGHLERLQTGTWDACIDVSGYQPAVVRQSAETLRGRIGRYLFISTVSVYAPGQRDVTSEDSPLCELPDPGADGPPPPKRTERGATAPAGLHDTYGELKVLCERVVSEVYGVHSTIVRPHIVAGPGDHTGRFTYWVEALAAGREGPGREVVAPGDGSNPVQYIDARDLANFVVHLCQQGTGGTFHAAVPALPWRDFLAGIAEGTQSHPALIWTPTAELRARGLGWNELPLFLPQTEDDSVLMRVDISRALAAGLQCRSVADTARDILAWRTEVGSTEVSTDQWPVGAPL